MKRKLFSLFIAALMSASMWATEGALLGRFTINANGDQIVFSKGNLQYKNGTGWRFAEHQWDFVGAWDTNDWVDLFGWGTWGEGKNPLNTSTTDGDYSWSTDFNGTLTNAVSTGWYTPSTDIFEYILNTRSTNSGIRYSKARVNGIDGLILLPDDWNSSIYTLINANIYYAWYESTIISLSDWTNQLEANGAVFIPRASMRDGASAGPGGDGHYWTTTPGYALHFTKKELSSSYGYCYKYYGFSVRLVRAVDPEEPYVLQQDEDGNYLLGSVQDWKALAKLVQTNPTANAKMTADINLGNDQTMIGSLSVPYAGIFDGQGYTLTVAYNQSDIKEGIGPFYVLGAATIQNLHVDGSMLTRCGIGGIAGIVKGNATIQRCWVSATLQSNGYSIRGTLGGICSVLEGVDDAHLIIEDCLFDGTIVDDKFCGGFMSHVERASCSVTMRRGLNIGTYPNTIYENGTFIREVLNGVRNLETSTLFHKKVFGSAQGTQVTDEQLASGAIAYNLQANRTDLVWGQRLGTDAEPVLTNDESYRVYISKNGGYTNNPEEAYEGLQQDGEGNYLLGCLRDWQEFVALGNSTAKAKMIADIDLGDDQTKFGGYNSGTGFSGTFDGQGHTLTIHYVDNDASSPGCAPFGRIGTAIIKNLHVAGTITTAGMRPAGITSRVNSTSAIQNCWSSVAISSSRGADIDAGGFVGRVDESGSISIEDCIFTGSIEYTDPNASEVGGFIGWTVKYSHQYLDHCLFAPSNLTFSTNNAYSGMLVGTNDVRGYINNSYYNSVGNAASILTPQGTYATDDQLADGTVATALQAGREEEIWVQDGATPMLKIFATTPTEAITANEDPDHAGIYYSTFFDGSVKYELPVGVEAYVATLSNDDLVLTKIAEAGEVIPANVAVILKSTVTPFTLTVSDADAVTFTATNDLQGSDTQIATPANCYVLAGTDGVVGFYHYTAANLNAHKAYVVYSGSNQAPRRMPFIFDQATSVENVQNSDIRSQKVVENGQLIIIRNGVRYNAAGQNVK